MISLAAIIIGLILLLCPIIVVSLIVIIDRFRDIWLRSSIIQDDASSIVEDI
jgi:hypothetical protein